MPKKKKRIMQLPTKYKRRQDSNLFFFFFFFFFKMICINSKQVTNKKNQRRKFWFLHQFDSIPLPDRRMEGEHNSAKGDSIQSLPNCSKKKKKSFYFLDLSYPFTLMEQADA
jgi:hypothetical protein